MISGNVHNPLTTFQAPNSVINTTDPSMFAARSVRPGPTSDLKPELRIAGGDEQGAELLEDIAKDDGQARFK